MSRKRKAPIYVLRVHDKETVEYTAISEESYRQLLLALAGFPVETEFRKAKEIQLSADAEAFERALHDVLCRPKKNPCSCLILEFLDSDVDADSYDDFSYALSRTLSKQNAVTPPCVVLAVSNAIVLKESVFFKKKLLPLCREKKVLLLLVSCDVGLEPEILVSDSQNSRHKKLPPLQTMKVGDESPRERISTETIRAHIQVLNGHFVLSNRDETTHITGVTNLRELVGHHGFIEQVRGDIVDELGSPEFAVLPLGIPLGGIRDLAIAIVEGRTESLLTDANIQEIQGRKIVILCDVLGSPDHLLKLISNIEKTGADEVIVCTIAWTKSCLVPEKLKVIKYVELPITDYGKSNGPCIYCSQDIDAIEGESFDDFARKIRRYDPITFWQLVSQDENFYHVGHWPSNRTPNHYHFRILAAPIISAYSKDIGLRVRNCLNARGILPNWVQRIVIPEEREAQLLGKAIASVLGLRDNDVISIPRHFLRTVAGQDIGRELIGYINDKWGRERLARANVLIVDQAAHHFKTLSALRAVCDHYDAIIMGFVVFIDRADTELSIGEYLHDSHYLALYSWPSPPRRAYECPCTS